MSRSRMQPGPQLRSPWIVLCVAVGCSDAASAPTADGGAHIGVAVEGMCETEGLSFDGGASDGGDASDGGGSGTTTSSRGYPVGLDDSGKVEYLRYVGCYESHTGDPSDWEKVRDAIRLAYASTWLFRTFEERSYYGVDHKTVVMALLVHEYFADEEANGVAITANIFDRTGLDPAYYVNVLYGGDAEVVHPPQGVTSDQILYSFSSPNQPTSYLAHSNLIPVGTTVLTKYQLYTLGQALAAIHDRFSAAYGPAIGNQGWYAMDIEFKFDNHSAPAELATLYVKQARPYPVPGGSN